MRRWPAGSGAGLRGPARSHSDGKPTDERRVGRTRRATLWNTSADVFHAAAGARKTGARKTGARPPRAAPEAAGPVRRVASPARGPVGPPAQTGRGPGTEREGYSGVT